MKIKTTANLRIKTTAKLKNNYSNYSCYSTTSAFAVASDFMS